MNLDKFKELLSVPSKTYQEEDMVEYICNELDLIEGVTYYRDDMMNVYATKGVLEEDEFYPMFIAHTDTVFEQHFIIVFVILYLVYRVTRANPSTTKIIKTPKKEYNITSSVTLLVRSSRCSSNKLII
jgi:hypothetical protein